MKNKLKNKEIVHLNISLKLKAPTTQPRYFSDVLEYKTVMGKIQNLRGGLEINPKTNFCPPTKRGLP